MPNETENKKQRRRREGSAVSIVLWWQGFHFSGRVIMCSVIFGLGLVLIGGIVFAINTNDDSTASGTNNMPEGMPVKPPSNVVGPVVMGIGGFIVTTGVIMCLFETQVCRKKPPDSSPLIRENPSDPENGNTEPKEVQSKTHKHGHSRHGHRARKDPASPKQLKHQHSKARSKEKKERTPPVAIETSKSFITSSEDNFLTPPSTLEHSALVRESSRDTESQTSTSLMKSFTSSGPSDAWTRSNEFQTPCTSFGESSISVESSTEVNKKRETESTVPNALLINAGFMTPVALEEEKVQKMASEIENQKTADVNSSSEQETSNCIQTNVNITQEPKKGIENEDLKLICAGKGNDSEGKYIGTETSSNVTEHQTLVASVHKQALHRDGQNTSDNTPGALLQAATRNEATNQTDITLDKDTTIISQDRKDKLNPEDPPQVVSLLAQGEHHILLPDDKGKVLLSDTNQDDTHRDLESSTSSDETIVSEHSVLEKSVNVAKSEKNVLEAKPNLTTKDAKLDEVNDKTLEKPLNVAISEETESEEKLNLNDEDVKRDVVRESFLDKIENLAKSEEKESEGRLNLINKDIKLDTLHDRAIEKPLNVTKSEKNGLEEKLNVICQDRELDTAKSNSDTMPENNLESQSDLSNIPEGNKAKSMAMQNDLKINESSSDLNTRDTAEGTVVTKTDFMDTHNIQPNMANENEVATNNLKQSEEDSAQSETIVEHDKRDAR